MVNTIKFSQFANVNLNTSTNMLVGVTSPSGGTNFKSAFTTNWTTATRPASPYDGLLGYNTDLQLYEFWSATALSWLPIGGGGGGGVSLVDTGLGLTGGPIVSTGTISFGPMNPNTVWANATAGVALPTMVPISSFALTNPALISIAGLTTVANQMLVTTAPDTYAVIGPDFNSTLITSATGVPQFSLILPPQVQTNITRLGAQAIALNMNSNFIHNLLDPIQPQDAATRAYVQLIASGLNVLLAVYAATTGNLNATYASPGGSGVGATLTNAGVLAPFSIDTVNPPVDSRILVKDQTVTSQNGIYILNPVGSGAVAWKLTRAADYDQPSEITPGDLVIVNNGAANQQTSWVETATVTTVGVDPILFSQFTFASTAFLLKANNLSDVANPLTSFNNISPLTTAGDLITRDSTNNIRLPTLASAGLLTNGSGVPGWVASTGTGAPVLGTNPTISNPKINFINDQSTNLPVLGFAAFPSAVNFTIAVAGATGQPAEFRFSGTDTNVNALFTTRGAGIFTFANNIGGVTGNILTLNAPLNAANYIAIVGTLATLNPVINAQGTDANLSITIDGKGTGGVNLKGTSTNNNAAVGYVGEFLSSVILSSSPVTFVSGTSKDVTSINLTAGDWDVFGNFSVTSGTVTVWEGWCSTTSATLPDPALYTIAFVKAGGPTPYLRVIINTTTTVYLSGRIVGTGTLQGCGAIYARRVR